MSTAIAEFDPKQLAALTDLFGGSQNDDLSQGVGLTFPVVSFRGKVWRVLSGGEERIIENADGDPAASIKVVIAKSSPSVSKIFYEKKYAEGDDAPPDCFSTDGVAPDPSAPKKQCATCAACPQNQFGSRITEDGKKAKACSDNRRMAVVFFPKVDSALGPCLLRVPPTSLAGLVKLKQALDKAGVPYQAVAVKIGFDQTVSYPKLTFVPTDILDVDQAKVIRDWMDDAVMESIFAQPVHSPEGGEAPSPAEAAEAENPAPVTPSNPEPEKAADEALGALDGAPKADEKPKADGKPKRDRAKVAEDDIDAALDDVLGALN